MDILDDYFFKSIIYFRIVSNFLLFWVIIAPQWYCASLRGSYQLKNGYIIGAISDIPILFFMSMKRSYICGICGGAKTQERSGKNLECKNCRKNNSIKQFIKRRYSSPPPENTKNRFGEKWKFIDTSRKYMVSNFSRIKKISKFGNPIEIINPQIGNTGYPTIRININKRLVIKTLHRAVAIVFIPNPNSLPVVNHKNGDKLDARIINLEWITHKGNTCHAIEFGLQKVYGSDNGMSILKENQVLLIYKSRLTYLKLSTKFNVSISTISHIKNGTCWGHLTGKVYKKRIFKMSEEKVLDIYYSKGTTKVVANKFGVGTNSVKLIRSGCGYTHITQSAGI